ncbi:hypothetical protein [Gloeobacter violaceus]|uniref:Gll0261 protein n=1 Tax=Gloeobacter violaceus (strain ATCC 29082 / PCC 7421) TaxID=251221 RepID=Q7NNZ7_GLOVI|nr:hypothetical protein [Gloeobacter violaceus]BAC88202.1 gll0261 [Gloeobacter violaceus PCC 7421]
MPMVAVRIALAALWLGFVAYAFLGGPPETRSPLQQAASLADLALGRGEPLSVALFNLMGLIPLAYLFLLVPDAHGEKLPAWPFAVASFAVGAFALLPYLICRRPHGVWPHIPPAGRAARLFDSRWFALAVMAGVAGLFWFGLTQGNWAAFAEQWRTSRFVHVMGLDFLVSTALLPLLIGDDLRRRSVKRTWPLWIACALPLFGPLLYLVLRPSLPARAV